VKMKFPFAALLLLLCSFLLPLNDVQAFLAPVAKAAWRPLSNQAGVLSEDVIRKFAQMIKGPGDLAKVKKAIGEAKLSSEAIEDAYARIAIHRGSIKREEAESLFKNLHGVDGFGSTMAKVIGVNPAATRGHLNELRIANAAAERGYKVEGIGIKYSDGIKNRQTDLDVLISRNGKKFPVEAKDYDDLTLQSLSNTMRPDMDSLVAYRNMASAPDKIHPVFTVTYRPSDPAVLQLMQKEADKRGIELIYGSPDEMIIQLEELAKLLN